MKYGKWIGGVLGWAVGGPLGSIFGFALGSFFDHADLQVTTVEPDRSYRQRTTAGDFSASLLVLSAAVMKADGKILRSELDHVKTFYTRQFGVEYTRQQMLLFREILQKEIPVYQVCHQIRTNMEYSFRLQLLHYLFSLANADGSVSKAEVDTVSIIGTHLGISSADFASIRAMFFKDTNSDYKILEIENTATNEEVKKAFRRMAVKYHPDKLSHLGEEFQKAAQEKFQAVQHAYDNIKKQRGM